MNKMVYSLLAAGFVSSSGLISCSKEIKTQDVYTPPIPKIVRETETADIKDWDKRPEERVGFTRRDRRLARQRPRKSKSDRTVL